MKDKQAQNDQMKEMWFLLSADQYIYSFILRTLRDGGNVGRDEHPITTTSALDIFIHTEGEICGNKQSNHENNGSRGVHQQKGLTWHNFYQKLQGGNQGGTEYNATLVYVRDRTTLNATCYKCCNPDHRDYNCSEAGCTGKCPLQVVHSFAQKQIEKNLINNNWVILVTCSSASVLKCIVGKNYETIMQKKKC